MHLLAKIATNLNLVTPDFQKFPGGGHAPRPPRDQHAKHASHAIFLASSIKKGPLFLKKNHPTKNPSYGPANTHTPQHRDG